VTARIPFAVRPSQAFWVGLRLPNGVTFWYRSVVEAEAKRFELGGTIILPPRST
jgi:hypothetical protein